MTKGSVEVTGKLVVDMRARTWCTLPYPGHKNGCPNYHVKQGCPPHKAPIITDWLVGTGRLWLVYVTFDLYHHVTVMQKKHPEWSDRQCRCCLYWQPAVNKALRELAPALANELTFRPGERLPYYHYKLTYCPEAMGVDVIHTAKNVGLAISAKHPLVIVHKIALVVELTGLHNVVEEPKMARIRSTKRSTTFSASTTFVEGNGVRG